MNRLKTIASLGAACAVLAGQTIATDAYSTSSYKWADWPVPFYVNPSNSDVSSSAATSAVQAAMDAWNTEAGTKFRWSYGGQVSDKSTAIDGRNVLIFRNTSSPDNTTAIATTYSWSTNGSRYDTDIIVWDGQYQFFTGSSGCAYTNGKYGVYIEDVVTHELGHALGLLHSNKSDATMYPTYTQCSTWMRTLSADDIAGAQALYPLESGNTAPSVSITAPTSGTSVSSGTSLSFSGSASDKEDGNLTSDLAWQSNIDGPIGTGGSFSRRLTAGTHTITASVSDSGSMTAQKSITLTVTATTNTAPTVTISSPASGASFASGASISFSGSASDTQDGNLTNGLVWRSNIDGQIGTGGGFSRTLTSGTHTITATVSDSGALIGEKSITVTVASSSSSGAKLTGRGYKVKGSQTADLSWSNLTGSAVDIYADGEKVMTAANVGSVTYDTGKKGGGSHTYQVCAAGTSTCSNELTLSF